MNLTLDLGKFKLGELVELEKKTGFSIADRRPEDRMTLEQVVYALYLQERRRNPSYTLEEANNIDLDALNAAAAAEAAAEEPDPTVPAAMTNSPLHVVSSEPLAATQ
jgi:hypothetical protein